MKHNDISKLYREELEKRKLDPKNWDSEGYKFADTYNGSEKDVIFYINENIDFELNNYRRKFDFRKGLAFCPQCNYAISLTQIDSCVIDFICPNCKLSSISNFYSINSTKHHKILDGSALQSSPNGTFITPPQL